MKNLKTKINNKMKEKKGITLVTLIITMIILLILAGITISQLTGSGIFEKAKESREKWQNAENEEETEIGKMVNNIDSFINNYRETGNNLSVEIIDNRYTNGFISATTTKDYDYIIITGCKWYYSGGYIGSSFTITGEYENYINKFGKLGNNTSDSDASDIAILKNVKQGAIITLGEKNSAVYKNVNIVGISLE